MLQNKTVHQADLYFRLFLHTVVPLHQCLIAEMCDSVSPPLELATRLEDIGQAHMRMASDLAVTLIDTGRIDQTPDLDDFAEAEIDRFVDDLFARSGRIRFDDGAEVDVRGAMEAVPAVADAMKAALWLAKYEQAKRGLAHT